MFSVAPLKRDLFGKKQGQKASPRNHQNEEQRDSSYVLVIVVGACFSFCVGFENVYFDFTLPGSYIYVCIKIEIGEIDLHNGTL